MNTTNADGTAKTTDVEEVLEVIDGESAEDKVIRLEGLNKQLFERTKKAEGFEKNAEGKWVKPAKPAATEVKPTATTDTSKKEDLSNTDMYVLIKADVPQEDITEVSDYAKMKGITIAEALNSPIIKETLKIRAEERLTANASHTGKTVRTSSPSGDDLLQRARQGDMPESDADIDKLIKTRKGIK